MKQTLLVMAGGTGGHVFPALAVAMNMRDRGWDIYWLGVPDSFEARIVPQYDIEMKWVNISGIRGKGIAQLMMAPVNIVRAILQSISVLKSVQPNVVLGMGGFVTGPAGVASKLMGVPLVIHEQNAIPGLTNKWLAKIAQRVLSAFPNSFQKKKVIVCGNPVRQEIIDIAEPSIRYMERSGPIRLLVVGGSLGALALNQTVAPAIANTRLSFEIRHQAGRNKLNQVQTIYKDNGLSVDASEFISDMAEAYAWADLVICRAGALTISEVAAAGVPSILIPYPYAVDDHQTKNAKYLTDVGAARLIQEADINTKRLSTLISEMSESRQVLLEMAQAARSVAMVDAVNIVANNCQEVARET